MSAPGFPASDQANKGCAHPVACGHGFASSIVRSDACGAGVALSRSRGIFVSSFQAFRMQASAVAVTLGRDAVADLILPVLKRRRPTQIAGCVVQLFAIPVRGLMRWGWLRANERAANQVVNEALNFSAASEKANSRVAGVGYPYCEYPADKGVFAGSRSADAALAGNLVIRRLLNHAPFFYQRFSHAASPRIVVRAGSVVKTPFRPENIIKIRGTEQVECM